MIAVSFNRSAPSGLGSDSILERSTIGLDQLEFLDFEIAFLIGSDEVVDQIRSIADDQDLLNEVYVQACSESNTELQELAIERQKLERQLHRDHSEIRKLAVGSEPTSVTSSRIADLHERVSCGEQKLAHVVSRVKNLESQQITHQEVMDAFKDFDNIWNVLNTRERTKIISLLVARIDFDVIDSTITISFHPSAIKSMATKTSEDAA